MVHCIAARVTRSSPPHRAEFVNSLSLMLRARLARSQGGQEGLSAPRRNNRR